MVLVIGRELDDIPRHAHQQRLGLELVRTKIEVNGEVPLLEEEDDIAVKAQGVLEHGQNGLALFYLFAANLSHDKVCPQGVLVNDGGQRQDMPDINGLQGIFLHKCEFLTNIMFLFDICKKTQFSTFCIIPSAKSSQFCAKMAVILQPQRTTFFKMTI